MQRCNHKPNTLIVDNCAERRQQLLDLIYNTASFDRVFHTESLDRGIDRLARENDRHKLDIIFLSDRFGDSPISRFITRSKMLSCARDSAYVLLLGTQDQERVQVAQGTLCGADGCLLEPYGVAHLEDIMELASTVKDRRVQARTVAIALLVDEAIVYVDDLAKRALSGLPPGRRRKHFRELGRVLVKLTEDAFKTYVAIVINKFTGAISGTPVVNTADALALTMATSEYASEGRDLSPQVHGDVMQLKQCLALEGFDTRVLEAGIERLERSMTPPEIRGGDSSGNALKGRLESERQRKLETVKARFAKAGITAGFLSVSEEEGED